MGVVYTAKGDPYYYMEVDGHVYARPREGGDLIKLEKPAIDELVAQIGRGQVQRLNLPEPTPEPPAPEPPAPDGPDTGVFTPPTTAPEVEAPAASDIAVPDSGPPDMRSAAKKAADNALADAKRVPVVGYGYEAIDQLANPDPGDRALGMSARIRKAAKEAWDNR